MTDPRYTPKPIVVITGGNGGVGYGIALRLLKQLAAPRQTDIVAVGSPPTPGVDAISPYATPNGLTLVLASRNLRKAEAARADLYEAVGKVVGGDRMGVSLGAMVNDELPEDKEDVASDGLPELEPQAYTDRWLDNLVIDLVPLDLASVDSTLACADVLADRYPYISHLVLNAGGGPFVRLDWPFAVWSMMTDLITSVTYPRFVVEEVGWMTDDKLGWTWQTNLFGHYILARALLPLIARYPRAAVSKTNAAADDAPRVVWTSSIEAQPYFYDEADVQAVQPNPKSAYGCSYISVKYQIGLAAWGFNRVIADFAAAGATTRSGKRRGPAPPVMAYSVVAQPGITAGLMFVQMLGHVLDFFMRLAFYFARLVGSPNHVVSPEKAGIPFTFALLAPLTTVLAVAVQEGPVRFGSKITRWGKEYVGVEAFDPAVADDPADIYGRKRWFDADRADRLMAYLDRTRDAVLRARGKG